MKTVRILLLLCLLLPRSVFAQVKTKGKTFQEIINEKEAYFENQRKRLGIKVLDKEGSEYNAYKKWVMEWGPRLGPDRSMDEFLFKLNDNAATDSLKSARQNLRSYGNTDAWKELGPIDKPPFGLSSIGWGGDRGVGPIRYIAFYKPNPSIMLAASLAGGLFYSSNKGLNWTNAGSDYWVRSGCNSAVFSPATPNTWYGCSNLGGQNNTSSIPDYGLCMGNFGGIYRTTNAGVSYDLVGDASDFYVEGGLTTLLKILIDPNNAAIGYVATSSGLYKSNNISTLNPGSVTWTLIHSGYIEDLEFKTDNSSVLFITVKALSQWDMKYSTDQGGSWLSLPNQPAHTNTLNITIETTENNSNLLYVLDRATTALAKLYVYNFTLQSWATKSSNLLVDYGSGHAFCVSNFNENIVYMGQSAYLYKSTNGGVQWTQIPQSMFHVDVEDIITPPKSCATCSQDVWIAHHGGVSYSSNACVAIQSRSLGLGVAEILGYSCAQQNPEVIAMGLNHDGTVLSGGIYSSNWTPSWETVYDGDGLPPLIDYSDTKYVWATAQASIYQLSQQYGHANTFNSTVFPAHNDWGNFIRQNQLFPNIVYIKGKNNLPGQNNTTEKWENLYRSNNRGISNIEQISDVKNINSIPFDAYIWGMYTAPASADYFYITVVSVPLWKPYLLKTDQLTANQTIVKNSWKEVNLSACVPPIPQYTNLAVDFSNPNIIYVTCNGLWGGGMIWKVDCTNPAAPTSMNMSGNLPATPVSNIVLEKNSNGGIYISDDFGDVYYTNSELQNTTQPWVRMDKSLPNIPIKGMEINYKASKLRIAMAGRGVWEHDLFCPADLFHHFSLPQTTNDFYEAYNEITSVSQVSSSSSITYRAGTYIELNPGFESKPNLSNYFLGIIHPCSKP